MMLRVVARGAMFALAILALVGGLVPSAEAQTFQAVDDLRVRYKNQGFTADFWRDSGGAPHTLAFNGFVLTSAFPGEGYQAVGETRNGNDADSTADGVSPYPIALFNRSDTAPYAYWSRESALSAQQYVVTGPNPFFWSHDTASSDNLIVAGQWEGREVPGIPLVFKGKPTDDWGGIALGNHGRFWTDPSESIVAEVPGGRIAFKTRIELKHASPDAFACIHYKCRFPERGDYPTEHEMWTSPGYKLCLNRLGHLEVWASDKATPVYSTVDNWAIREWLAAQMHYNGVHVELRTHNWSTSIQEIWLKDTYVPGSKPFLLTTINRASPINTGPHFGISAYSTGGEVRFNERTVCDMGLQVTNSFRPVAGGALEFDTVWSSLTSDRIPMYSATQQLFANATWAQGVHCAQFGWSGGIAAAKRNGAPQELFVGKRNGNNRGAGLVVKIVRAKIDDRDSTGAYASLQINPGVQAIIHANALDERLWHGFAAESEYQFRKVQLTTQINYVP